MSSFVTGFVRSVSGKITRCGFDTRTGRPPASTVVSSTFGMLDKFYGKRRLPSARLPKPSRMPAEAQHLLDPARPVGVAHLVGKDPRHERDLLGGRALVPVGRVRSLLAGELVARGVERRPQELRAAPEVPASAVADRERAADVLAEHRAQVLLHPDVPAAVLAAGA